MDFSKLLGRSAPFNTARDEVNVPMIRRWCDVMGDEDPVYTDPAIGVLGPGSDTFPAGFGTQNESGKAAPTSARPRPAPSFASFRTRP